ncbi:GTP-binding protein REM 2-like isoform X2 [Vespula squamosa]|uniref:GTP-binding protein REM 2-like isoform X2 n=1 Tax=Vespula squamosa TaxID=30214 RepID=A0ABD2BM16_VESSQ
MATNSPESSIHSKSPRSPRQLPQLPRIPISGQRSLSQLSVTKTPSTPLVFEFPAEYYPETPNTNFDFDTFPRNMDNELQRGSSRSPSYYSINKNQRSPNSSDTTLYSPGRKSPIFKFCDKNLISSSSNSTIISANRTATSSNFVPKSPNMVDRRRNSSFGLAGPKSPISPTIVTPMSSSSHASPKHTDSELRSCKDGTFGAQDENIDRNCSMNEKIRAGKMGGYLNRSQGCLNEATRCCEGTSVDTGNDRKEKNIARRSTSDLTEIGDAETEVTLLSSPRRRGSMKGGLAYLASRRGSRDSQCSNVSNISNEDVGPLNFNAHPRVRQRRTSNFLELPEDFISNRLFNAIPVPDHIRPRVHSLPEKAYNPRAGDDLYRLRAFSITHKGVVNRGDSIISRRSRSNTSVNSSR